MNVNWKWGYFEAYCFSRSTTKITTNWKYFSICH